MQLNPSCKQNKSHDASEKDNFAKVANGLSRIGDFYLFGVRQGVQKGRTAQWTLDITPINELQVLCQMSFLANIFSHFWVYVELYFFVNWQTLIVAKISFFAYPVDFHRPRLSFRVFNLGTFFHSQVALSGFQLDFFVFFFHFTCHSRPFGFSILTSYFSWLPQA